MSSKLFNKKNMTLLKKTDFENGKLKHKLFNGKSGMFIVYQDWCHFCVMTKPVWIQFKTVSGTEFPVGAVCGDDYTHKDVTGFPSIMHVKPNGSVSLYKGNRDLISLTNVMCKKTPKYKICK